MMKRSHQTFCVMVVGGLLAASLAAQTQWAQEPNSVFGIPIGAAIPAGSIPTCPSNTPVPSTMCIERGPLREMATVKALPIPKLGYAADVYFDGDVVASVDVITPHTVYHSMRATLIERYGPPSSIEQSSAQNLAGASLGSEVLRWKGQTNSITLTERSHRMNTSSTIFSNHASAARINAKQRDAAKGSASKF